MRTILDVFRDNVRLRGTTTALRWRSPDGWNSITWSQYGGRVEEQAAGLVDLGVAPGDRVAILSTNRPDWHMADVATLMVGAVSVPLYPTSTASQLAYVLGHAGVRVCFVEGVDQLAKVLLHRHELPALEHLVIFDPADGLDDDTLLPLATLHERGRARLARDRTALDDRAASIRADGLATIVYTSGTTGPPKGAMITHSNVMATVRGITAVIPIGPSDRFISFLPLSHIAERVVSHFCQIVAGGETWFARSFATVAEDLRDCRPTIFFAVPRVWEKFHEVVADVLAKQTGPARSLSERYLALGAEKTRAEQDGRRPSVGAWLRYRALDAAVGRTVRRRMGLDRARILASGAAPIHPDLLRWFHGFGLPIAEVYGQTEDCGPTTINPPHDIRIGTVGRVVPGLELRIAPDGEVLVRGAAVSPGYFHDDAGTAELIDADGWMHSGDLGRIDADGYLTVTGRKKDLIINAQGKNIAPQNIETELQHEPLIGQAVVLGDRHPYLVALLTIDTSVLDEWAAEHGKMADIDALVHDPDLEAEIKASVERVNAEHAPAERIRRWQLLAHNFTIADGEMTPTYKIKRAVVSERYAPVVDELYAEPAEEAPTAPMQVEAGG